MEFTKEKRKKLTLWIIGIFTVCSLIFLGVQNISTVASAVKWCIDLIMPLIMGFGFAMVLDVPMKFFENHIFTKTKNPKLQKLRSPLAFVISIVVIVAILAGIIIIVIPELIEAVKVIIQIVIDFANKITKMSPEDISALPFGEYLMGLDWKKLMSSDFINKLSEMTQEDIDALTMGEYLMGLDWQKLLTPTLEWLKNKGSSTVNTAVGTISSVVTTVLNIGVALVFASYILLNKKKLKSQAARLVKAWLPEKFGNWVIHAAEVGNENFRNFISGQTLEAVILGVLCMVGMLILRIPYAPMVGTLVGVTALIPVVGGVIGATIGAIMILTVSPVKALIFIVYLIILQNLEGDLIYPRVMGSRVKLPAMWILAAVTIGGSVAGPLGMLLSVPIASTAYCLIKEATDNRISKKEALAEGTAEAEVPKTEAEAEMSEKEKPAVPEASE